MLNLYSISRDCKYSYHVYVYSRTTCGQEIKYLSIYLSILITPGRRVCSQNNSTIYGLAYPPPPHLLVFVVVRNHLRAKYTYIHIFPTAHYSDDPLFRPQIHIYKHFSIYWGQKFENFTLILH